MPDVFTDINLDYLDVSLGVHFRQNHKKVEKKTGVGKSSSKCEQKIDWNVS